MFSARAGETPTLKAPEEHGGVWVCVVEAPCFTTTVTGPSPFEQVPLKVGVVLFVKLLFAGAVRVTAGAVVSIVNVDVAAYVVPLCALPSVSAVWIWIT